MLKILAIGDPHFQTTNAAEVALFVDRVEELAKKQTPNLIVILGDVLHTHEKLHTAPFNMACKFIGRMRKIAETIVLVGNHDMINNQQFLTENHWMNPLKEWGNVTIVDKVMIRNVKGYKFLFAPYVYVGRFREALETCPEAIAEMKRVDAVFCHQEFMGCKMGAIQSVDGDEWPEDYPCVVSGHIHDRQNPQKNVYYCGTPMQHTYGDNSKNIVPILTFWKPGKKYRLEEIDLGLPRKKTVYTDVASIEEFVPGQGQDQVKLSVTGNYEEFKAIKKSQKYRDLIKAGTKIVFKPKKVTLEEKENRPEVNETDFQKILSALVMFEKNVSLYCLYEKLVNDKILDESEILLV